MAAPYPKHEINIMAIVPLKNSMQETLLAKHRKDQAAKTEAAAKLSDLTVAGIGAVPCGKCASTKLQHDKDRYHEVKCRDCDNHVRNYIGPKNAVDEWNRQQPRLRKQLVKEVAKVATPPKPDLLPCGCGNDLLEWNHTVVLVGSTNGHVTCPKCGFRLEHLGSFNQLVQKWNKRQQDNVPSCPECGKRPTIQQDIPENDAVTFEVDCGTEGCVGQDTCRGNTYKAALAAWKQICEEHKCQTRPVCPNCGCLSVMDRDNEQGYRVRCGKCPTATLQHATITEAHDAWGRLVGKAHQDKTTGKRPTCPDCGGVPSLIRQENGLLFVQCCCCSKRTAPYKVTRYAWAAWAKATATTKARQDESTHPVCPDCGGTAEPAGCLDLDVPTNDTWAIYCKCGKRTLDYHKKKEAWEAWAVWDTYVASQDKAPAPLRAWKCASPLCGHELGYTVTRPTRCPVCDYQGFVEITKQQETSSVNEKYQCIYCGLDVQTQDQAGRRTCINCGRTAFRKIEQNPTEEKQMNDIKTTFDQTNTVAIAAAKQGAQQAIAVKAQEVIMDQARKLLGDKFPDELYCTPLGAAALNIGMCYAVLFAANAFPDMPGAPEVQQYSKAAMVGCTAKSFEPMMQMAQELFAGIAAQAKLAGIAAAAPEAAKWVAVPTEDKPEE